MYSRRKHVRRLGATFFTDTHSASAHSAGAGPAVANSSGALFIVARPSARFTIAHFGILHITIARFVIAHFTSLRVAENARPNLLEKSRPEIDRRKINREIRSRGLKESLEPQVSTAYVHQRKGAHHSTAL